MKPQQILSLERCHSGLDGVSRKRILGTVSRLLAEAVPALDGELLYQALMVREGLGSTGLGNGIAIPHCRLQTCDCIVGSLISLREPIDFDAIDGKPVDLLFVLVVPVEHTDEHVRTLARLAEMFSDGGFCKRLRGTEDRQGLYQTYQERCASLK